MKPGNENRDRIDLGFFMRYTLLQNLHRFQEGVNLWKPLSDKAFMRRVTGR